MSADPKKPTDSKRFAEVVEDYGREMERIAAEIALLTRLRKARRETATREIGEALAREHPPMDLVMEVYDAFYWDHMAIPAGPLMEAITSKKTKFLPPRPRAFKPGCPQCGKPYRITSKEDYKEQVRYLKWEAKSGHQRPVCNGCRVKASRTEGDLAQEARWKERLHELRSMPYCDYLQSPEWQVTRQTALKRARFRCQLDAGHSGPLDVHHNTYANRGQERPEDLLVLCRDCHAKFHEVLGDQADEELDGFIQRR